MKLKKIPKIILFVTLVTQVIIVQGQELKLNYAGGSVTLPLDQSRNMSINPTTGDIDVSTTNNAEQISDGLELSCTGDAPNVNLTKTTNGTTSANINWNLGNDPVYCEKSGQWSGLIQGNPLVNNGSQNVTVNGNYKLTCHNAFGSNEDTEIVSNIAAAPTLAISASPAVVNSGGTVTVAWNIGNSPTQCVKSGDWPTNGNMTAQEITNETHDISITNVTSNKSFSLICTNNAGSSGLKTATVSVAGGATWPSCSGAAASILNGNEDRNILAQGANVPQTDYNGFYDNIYDNAGSGDLTPWPGSFGANIGLNLEKNHYIAAKFTTPNESIDAKFITQVPSNTQGVPTAAYTVSISECPGDFNVHLNQPACKFNFETFKWSTTTNPPGPAGFFCELERNKTYFLNIVHSDNSENNNYATSDCSSQGDGCGHLSSQSLVIIGRSPDDD